MNSPTTQVERLHFYGGMHALFVPFGVMLARIAILGVQGAAVPHAFWVVMLVSILVGLVLAKNKSVYIDALIEGIGRRAGVQGRGRRVARAIRRRAAQAADLAHRRGSTAPGAAAR